jgi:Toprim domain-containing protein
MSPTDARAYYAALGIELPAWSQREAPVRCFAQPDAHNRGDRSPSCSVNLASGAWNCHGCGAHGGAYDAAIARGHSPRSAMDLLIAHRLAEPRDADHSVERTALPRRTETAAPAESIAAVLTADDGSVRYWADGLEDNGRLLRRLALERAWSARVIRDLQIGASGSRITIPIRNARGELRGVLRYDPFGRRDPKMLAATGTRLGLIPHPARVATNYVVLVEGPPDMVAARSLGLAAIAVPGTNAWQPSWAQLLHDRHVKIVMDCDAAGRRAAEQIHASLRAAAVTSEIVDLWPDRDDGYDLTDRIVERKRQRPGRMTTAAVASLLAPVPPVHRKRPRARARVTQEAAR